MAEQIKLIYLINSLEVGEAEVGMCRLLDGLDPQEYEVTVLALDGHSTSLIAKIPSWVRAIDLRLRSGIGFSILQELYFPSFLEGLDIYFQPSRSEGLCINVLEALAAGLPVVGSDVGGIGRNVNQDISGSVEIRSATATINLADLLVDEDGGQQH